MKAELDTKTSVKGINVSEKAMEEINLTRHEFPGEWNDQISPTIKRPLDEVIFSLFLSPTQRGVDGRPKRCYVITSAPCLWPGISP